MATKNAMTADFLRSAYGGESLAHMRYLYWADVARDEGFDNIGKLFDAIAYAEQVHANNHFDITNPVSVITMSEKANMSENIVHHLCGL